VRQRVKVERLDGDGGGQLLGRGEEAHLRRENNQQEEQDVTAWAGGQEAGWEVRTRSEVHRSVPPLPLFRATGRATGALAHELGTVEQLILVMETTDAAACRADAPAGWA
jgi:hypothetical protein